ncbi:hypothetical protein TrVE_jg6061 [Triparma verrucosa]|uniref:RNA ligase/cyclic nucleotide phosphodiesterase n=1 Tax=Triparma verrucosa TaxID=1606542 RepID=A0A9W7F1D7_9STRA|nr:hypothetical protein TrVE_jg6061 [Triparma verrucosa]
MTPYMILILLSLLHSSLGSSDTCEKIDGDCPDSCSDAGYLGSENFNAIIPITPFHPSFIPPSHSAQKRINSNSPVQSTSNVLTGLHTTLYYFCCYTPSEKSSILNSLHSMSWSGFNVSYDTFGCNLDHDNETIYLHSMPIDQTLYFNLARRIEKVIEGTGAHVVERETLFHMTLARVGVDYPVDDVVEEFLEDDFEVGSLEVDWFYIDGEVYRSKSG